MMNEKVKKILIPFVLMLAFNLGSYYLTVGQNFGEGLSPHLGILVISGLILGPYGSIGAVFGNFLCDMIRGYGIYLSTVSAIFSFGITYFGYKLWYGTSQLSSEVTNPKLNNTHNVLLFLTIVLFCSSLYAILHGRVIYLIFPETIPITDIIQMRFFLNIVNASLIFGIVGIWISNKRKFFHIPKISKKKTNYRFYEIIGILLALSLIFTLIIDSFDHSNVTFIIVETIVIFSLLVIYLKKPLNVKAIPNDSKSITENVMNIFHLTILSIVIIGILVSYDSLLLEAIGNVLPLSKTEIMISIMALIDALLLIFFIPAIVVLRYIEKNVIEPILSFSKMEEFIHENQKIESDRLIEIYSKYIKEQTEIGTLARSYTDLIKFNNHYIENIHQIESEKERIEAELDIATRIQAANLPTKPLVNDQYIVNGYSKPAKEVGGDFFDYYEVDNDNLAILIGDASGKGVPAAILAMITQVVTKQLLKDNRDPSKVLQLLNNQLCENNTESMFITAWLGIYNKTTKKLIFSNAGHEHPLLKENNEFKSLNIDSGLVLGIMEDFDYQTEEITLSDEIVLYTDGITDANNKENEMYGKENLLKFFNEFKDDNDPITILLDNIVEFSQNETQFDDMTLLYLKIKDQ